MFSFTIVMIVMIWVRFVHWLTDYVTVRGLQVKHEAITNESQWSI